MRREDAYVVNKC